MELMNVDNNGNQNASGLSITEEFPSRSATNTLSNNMVRSSSIRRSARISTQSSRGTSMPKNQSVLHRTISRGLEHNHSPKLNVRRKFKKMIFNLMKQITESVTDNESIVHCILLKR